MPTDGPSGEAADSLDEAKAAFQAAGSGARLRSRTGDCQSWRRITRRSLLAIRARPRLLPVVPRNLRTASSNAAIFFRRLPRSIEAGAGRKQERNGRK